MERKQVLLWGLLFAVALVLAGAVSLTLAQGPDGDDDVLPQGDVSVATLVGDVIPIQGRLLDAHGNPINGTRSITMTLYDASTGGTALCTDSDYVTAVNGLFNAYMHSCTAQVLNGRRVWLGIKVGSDAEMTPRQRIYAVPYAWSLRPGAIISNTATSGHGLEVWSAGGGGRDGTALWVQNTVTDGIALWAEANSSDTSVVISNGGTGPLLKGFGGDGGEDEIRINNNGSIETKADSYIFVPGTQIIKNLSDDTTRWDVQTNGSVRIWRGAAVGNKFVYLSIVMPSVLYGQPVEVESITVYYRCQDGTKNYISSTTLQKQTDADSGVLLIDNTTDRKSDTATTYTLPINHVLSLDQGSLGLYFNLHFEDDTNYIQLGGVRIQLGHHRLY